MPKPIKQKHPRTARDEGGSKTKVCMKETGKKTNKGRLGVKRRSKASDPNQLSFGFSRIEQVARNENAGWWEEPEATATGENTPNGDTANSIGEGP